MTHSHDNHTTIRLRDKYNNKKVWIIKRYSCGHYYINQEINGRLYYKKFQKVTKAYLVQLFKDDDGFYFRQLQKKGAHFISTVERYRDGKIITLNWWFDTDEEFDKAIQHLGGGYITAAHNAIRIGSIALSKRGEWRHIRAEF